MTDREFGKYMSAIAQGDRESLRAVYDPAERGSGGCDIGVLHQALSDRRQL